MDYTTNLNLKKPNVNEYYSIGDINDNMDTIDETLQDLSTGSGDLSGLTTTAKDSLVEAINELDGNIGDLSGLTTTAKTNLVNAVNELNTKSNELSQNMSGFEDDISELTSDMSGKQNKISNQTFKFTPNDAGITTSAIQCFRYGNVCIVNGIFTPNQAGTPLTLGSFNVHPTQNITFPITGYEKVASYGTLSASGVFQCNIPGAMANAPCVINFAFLTA